MNLSSAKEHKWEILIASIGFIIFLLSIAFFLNLDGNHSDNVIRFEKKGSDLVSSDSGSLNKAGIMIHIDGAVEKPGVYELNENSRLKDALNSAGGLSENADRAYFARNFNLSQILKDQQKIYIPNSQEILHNSAIPDELSQIKGVSTSQVNINTASQVALEALPGIGPVTAQKIISGRPYQLASDLVSKKKVSKKVFEEIKESIIVN